MTLFRVLFTVLISSSLAVASVEQRCSSLALRGAEEMRRAEQMLESARAAHADFVTQVKALAEATQIPVARMSFRVKDRESFLKKLSERSSLEDVFDLTAGRIVVVSKANVSVMSTALQRGFPNSTVETHSKPSGYQSIHVNITLANGVRAEVQVTTLANHLWSHWEHDRIYKPSGPEDLARRESLKVYSEKLREYLERFLAQSPNAVAPSTAGLLAFQFFDMCQAHLYVTRPLPAECFGLSPQ